ncbi:hypothetical protein LEMLEM_LOCUS7836 [Lemmus lemmus]
MDLSERACHWCPAHTEVSSPPNASPLITDQLHGAGDQRVPWICVTLRDFGLPD